MRLEVGERDELERSGVRGLEHDRRRHPGLERLAPARGDDTPPVARLEAAEEVLRSRRREIVSDRLGEREELVGHHRADRVEAGVATLRAAVAVPEEAGHGIERARLQVAAEDVHPRIVRSNGDRRTLLDRVKRSALTHPLAGIAAGAVAVAVVTGAVALLDEVVPVLSLGVLYVFAVLPIAVFWGTIVAIPVAVASMLAFNFFFLPPVYTLTLADRSNWLALAVYVVTAVVVGSLASRYRSRGEEAEQREREAALLADIATELLGGTGLEQELGRIEERAAAVLGVSSVRIVLGDHGRSPAHEAPYVLTVDGRPVGALFTPETEEPALATRRRLLPALASLLAVAHEREKLTREALEAETLRRSDTIKTAVIQAVSHDLRTPLATIEQALDGLESGELALTDDDRAALLETIRAEHLRLKRLVENLLDLSRLQARAAETRPELWTAEELVAQAVDELGGQERVTVTAPPSWHRSASTRCRSSARSSTCSRTRFATRPPVNRCTFG